MQLGVRWRAGDPPHRGVPQVLLEAVLAAERMYPTGDSWTLTWLEGRPRAELLDGGASVLCEVHVDASGQVQTATNEVQASQAADAAAGTANLDNDDDDWLN